MATLALWMDFWDWDGAPASVSVTAIIVLSTFTDGGARGAGTDNTYQMLPPDYWDQREAALREDAPKPDVTQPKEDVATAGPPPTPKPDSARAGLLSALRNASSLDELKNVSAQLAGKAT